MRVLIFGAGASQPAGYPLARGLLDEVEREAGHTSSVQYRDAWREWEEFRESIPASLRLIAYNSNPEIVLSLADLFIAAVESEDDCRTSSAIRAFLAAGTANSQELESYFNSQEREALSNAFAARVRLLDALEYFFWFRHHEDGEQRAKRDYLRPLLESLDNGDAVITLNWDTVAERTLAEVRRWHPGDGYGFARELLVKCPNGQTTPLPPGVLGRSTVQVLKLHGSFGWRRTDSGMYLDSVMLLREFGFHLHGKPADLVDSATPEFYAPDPMLMSYPSFLKRLDHPIVDAIWRRASEILANADSVEVWGYSLPESDGAIRSLLQVLSTRARSGEVAVVVHDPSIRVLSRWKDLLGDNIELRREKL